VIGDPQAVAEKITYIDEVLGGISRFTIQLTAGTVSHEKVMRAIELLGTEVAPMIANQWSAHQLSIRTRR
jgi:hypothetical protein